MLKSLSFNSKTIWNIFSKINIEKKKHEIKLKLKINKNKETNGANQINDLLLLCLLLLLLLINKWIDKFLYNLIYKKTD